MKHLSSRDIQQVGNKILLFIKEVCDSNNIKFFLAYGTALGAVRHKGFIPWDDDIDIYMLRSDYEKFWQIVSISSSRYKLLDVEHSPEYFMPQVKMIDSKTQIDWHIVNRKSSLGVWVDIYVLDNVPDDDRELKRFQRKLNFLQLCFRHSLYRNKIKTIKNAIGCLIFSWTKLVGPRYFSKIMVSMSKRYNAFNTRRIAPSSFTASSREDAVLERDILGCGTQAEFEGNSYLIPERIDTYLRHFYGNYMDLPPLEKRVSNHTADFYLMDE